MDLSPRGIREHLELTRPIYARTSAYGHFGREPEADGGFSWERTDLVDELRARLLSRRRGRTPLQRLIYGRRTGPSTAPGAPAAARRAAAAAAGAACPQAGRSIRRACLRIARSALWLEIGFGGGEHLAAQAAAHPEVGLLGCEPFISGVARLLSLIEAQGLSNVRLFTDDARLLLQALAGRLPRADLRPVPRPLAQDRATTSGGSSMPRPRPSSPGCCGRAASCAWRPTIMDYARAMLLALRGRAGAALAGRGARPDWRRPAAPTGRRPATRARLWRPAAGVRLPALPARPASKP